MDQCYDFIKMLIRFKFENGLAILTQNAASCDKQEQAFALWICKQSLQIVYCKIVKNCY
jgi:hypothetical protein